MSIPTLTLEGPPFVRGRAHGAAHREAIRSFAEERVRLAGSAAWTGRELDRDGVLALAQACWDHHERYAPSLAEETRGMARATGLSPAELVVVAGFTDVLDAVRGGGHEEAPAPAPRAAMDCTAFLVPGARSTTGDGYLGQTWDMHESAVEHVLLLDGRPEGEPAFLAFTSAGCPGMIGMNEHGIAVGITNLPGTDGRAGVTWPFVVRAALAQSNFADALTCITDARLAGAHDYLVMDGEGRGANVEAMATRLEVTPLEGDVLVHTNHVLHEANAPLARESDEAAAASTRARLARGRELLDRTAIDERVAMDVTRDERAICYPGRPPRFVGTCGAVVMRPASRELWAVRGLPSRSPYARFSVGGPAS